MATDTVTDSSGSPSIGSGTQQITTGTITWETCTPRLDWTKTTWTPGSLDPTIASSYNLEDWVFSGTLTMRWTLGASLIREEIRTFSWLNGAVVSDSITINGTSSVLANSVISSIGLTTSTYVYTPVTTGNTFTPSTALFHRPETIAIVFRSALLDQSTITFDTFEVYATINLFSVYIGTRNFGSGPIQANGGQVGGVVWDIYRSASGTPYGLAWEDCTGGGGDTGGCTYTEDPATSCTYTEDAEASCAYAEDTAPACGYSEA